MKVFYLPIFESHTGCWEVRGPDKTATLFVGPSGRERANAYALWMNDLAANEVNHEFLLHPTFGWGGNGLKDNDSKFELNPRPEPVPPLTEAEIVERNTKDVRERIALYERAIQYIEQGL